VLRCVRPDWLQAGFSTLPPNTLDSLKAISGEMPRLPLTSSESVEQVTPGAAASVMLKPRGSMHWRNKAARTGVCLPASTAALGSSTKTGENGAISYRRQHAMVNFQDGCL